MPDGQSKQGGEKRTTDRQFLLLFSQEHETPKSRCLRVRGVECFIGNDFIKANKLRASIEADHITRTH